MTMTKQEIDLVLAKHKKWLNDEPGGEPADLSYADLRNADLSHADLSYANLRNADLRNANLSYAHLRNANFNDANLSNANIKGTIINYR